MTQSNLPAEIIVRKGGLYSFDDGTICHVTDITESHVYYNCIGDDIPRWRLKKDFPHGIEHDLANRGADVASPIPQSDAQCNMERRQPKDTHGVRVAWSDDDQMFVARILEMDYCSGHGDTREAAIAMAEDNMRESLLMNASPLAASAEAHSICNEMIDNLRHKPKPSLPWELGEDGLPLEQKLDRHGRRRALDLEHGDVEDLAWRVAYLEARFHELIQHIQEGK